MCFSLKQPLNFLFLAAVVLECVRNIEKAPVCLSALGPAGQMTLCDPLGGSLVRKREEVFLRGGLLQAPSLLNSSSRGGSEGGFWTFRRSSQLSSRCDNSLKDASVLVSFFQCVRLDSFGPSICENSKKVS